MSVCVCVVLPTRHLIMYCRPQVFFKMDKAGDGEEVRLANLPQAKELAFQGFGHHLFQEVWLCCAAAVLCRWCRRWQMYCA